jgi:hypothetical protein
MPTPSLRLRTILQSLCIAFTLCSILLLSFHLTVFIPISSWCLQYSSCISLPPAVLVNTSQRFSSSANNTVNTCSFLAGAQGFAKRTKKRLANPGRPKGRPNNTNNANVATSTPSTSNVTEFAGNASASIDSPPLQLDADFRLNTDTGATAHMTPHRHWLSQYKPYVVPIRLANGEVVYSAGVGVLRFRPRVNGVELGPIQFSRFLHVPLLRSNLLSILYLTRMHHWTCVINPTTLAFMHDGTTRFCATIDQNNAGYLDGHVVEATSEFANLSSTITAAPLSSQLWHRRCVHHSHSTIKRMPDMVTALVINSKELLDPICEPCLAGKMNANPFPSSQNHTTVPLHRIHSDLHEMKTLTTSGYRYWVTDIDDATSYRSVVLLKRKSEAFEAFKTFKAYAENTLGSKIKELKMDQGGEFVSNASRKFCSDAGIPCDSQRKIALSRTV